jgi:hypothetical protein
LPRVPRALTLKKKSRASRTQCVYAVYVILRISDYVFPKQYDSVGLGNAVAM